MVSKKRSRAVAGHEIRPPADRAVAGGASPPLGGARAARQDCQDILPLSCFCFWEVAISPRVTDRRLVSGADDGQTSSPQSRSPNLHLTNH